MQRERSATIHGTAVLVGARALLIRGAAGSGKSSLALRLLQAAAAGVLPFARLVGDDRLHADVVHGRLLLRPAEALAGLIEVRGIGLFRLPYEPVAVAGGIVDLATESLRMPAAADQCAEVAGVMLPRLAVPARCDPMPLLLAFPWPGPGSPPGAWVPISDSGPAAG